MAKPTMERTRKRTMMMMAMTMLRRTIFVFVGWKQGGRGKLVVSAEEGVGGGFGVV